MGTAKRRSQGVHPAKAAPETAAPAVADLEGAMGNQALLELLRVTGEADPEQAFALATAGGARRLPHQEAMEAAFDRDLSEVQAHTGGPGERAGLAALGAQAAAQGSDIAFRDPNPSPEVVAHEVAHHVLGEEAAPAAGAGVSSPGSTEEREAETAARAVSDGRSPELSEARDGANIHLSPEGAATGALLGGLGGGLLGTLLGPAGIAVGAGLGAAVGGVLGDLVTGEEDPARALAEPWVRDMIDFMGSQDRAAIQEIVDNAISIVRFDTAFDVWEYDDGHQETEELTGLRGNTDEDANTIRIRKTLPVAEAATTLFHELNHYGRPETTTQEEFLQEEIDVRVQTEEFAMRHGLPETQPGYRNADGTVDRALIDQQIHASDHYNPQGRHRIDRRYVGEATTRGWYVPAP